MDFVTVKTIAANSLQNSENISFEKSWGAVVVVEGGAVQIWLFFSSSSISALIAVNRLMRDWGVTVKSRWNSRLSGTCANFPSKLVNSKFFTFD